MTHNNNKEHYEKNIYNNLKEYMFYPEVIHKNMNIEYHTIGDKIKSVNTNTNNKMKSEKTKNINIVQEKEESSPFFIPHEKDKLFWCFYIFIHGEYDYKIAKNNSFAIEKKWKMDTLAKLKEKEVIDFLKSIKIKVVDLEDELMNKEKLSLKGLQVFCMIYKLSVIYVSGRTFCEFIQAHETDAKTFVIINMPNKEDGIHRNPDIKNIRDTYWKIENVSKPLKGCSAYSLTELQVISTKMGISLEDTESKKKKTMKVLYQELLSHF